MNTTSRLLCNGLLSFLVLLGVLNTPAGAAEHVLARKGTTSATIVIGANASTIEQFAAQQLQEYLLRISGARVPIEQESATQRESATFSNNLLILGTPTSNSKVKPLESRIMGLAHDGFILRTSGSNLILGGTNPRAVLYAVYTLLEEQLGVSWAQFSVGDQMLSETDEVVPRRGTVKLSKIDATWQPSLPFRGTTFGTRKGTKSSPKLFLPLVSWMAKNKMNTVILLKFPVMPTQLDDIAWHDALVQELFPAIEKYGLDIEMPGHSFTRWLPPSDKLFSEHPEYFALIGGQRKQHVNQFAFCLAHPKVAELMAENIKAFLKQHPTVDIIDVYPDDGYGQCQCADCKAMGARGSKPRSTKESITFHDADYYIRFFNDVSKRIKKDYPNVKLSTLAYVNVTQPSQEVHADDGTNVMFANYWRCYTHAINEECEYNEVFHDAIQGWIEQDIRLVFWEYLYGMGAYSGLPFPVIGTVAKDVREYVRLGVHGVNAVSVVHTDPVYHLNGYAFARLAWNPQRTTDDILREYCDRYFGKASDPMYDFHQAWEQAMAGVKDHSRPTSIFFTNKLANEKLFEELEFSLMKAERLVATDTVRRRMGQVRKHWFNKPKFIWLADQSVKNVRRYRREGDTVALQREVEKLQTMRYELNTLGRLRHLKKAADDLLAELGGKALGAGKKSLADEMSEMSETPDLLSKELQQKMLNYLEDLNKWIMTLDVGSGKLKNTNDTTTSIWINGNFARVLMASYRITGNKTYRDEALRWCDTFCGKQKQIITSHRKEGGCWPHDRTKGSLYFGDGGTAVTALAVGYRLADDKRKARYLDIMERYARFITQGSLADPTGLGQGVTTNWVITHGKDKGALGCGYYMGHLSIAPYTTATATTGAAFFAELFGITANPQYRDIASGAVKWILRNRKEDGQILYILDGTTRPDEWPFCTLSYCGEGFVAADMYLKETGIQGLLRQNLKRTVQWFVAKQNPDGSWGEARSEDQERSHRAVTLLVWYYNQVEPDPGVAQAVRNYCRFLLKPENSKACGIKELVRTTGHLGLTVADIIDPGSTF